MSLLVGVAVVGVIALLAVSLLGTTTDQRADRFEPVGSTIDPRFDGQADIADDTPDGAATTGEDETTTTTPIRDVVLPPLPERARDEVPGADPADHCVTAEEHAALTGQPWVPRATIDPDQTMLVNHVRFTTSRCHYQNVGVIDRAPDPDGAILAALRSSEGEVRFTEQAVGGRTYLVTFEDHQRVGRIVQSLALWFSHGGATYLVTATSDEVVCDLGCAARLAEAVVARAG